MKMKIEQMKRLALETGFFEAGALDINALVYEPQIREICETNRCGAYGKLWVCPPAIGTLAECKERVEQYQSMLLFSAKFDLEDPFDYEGMMDGVARFQKMIEAFDAQIRPLTDTYLLLANGGCGNCKTCTCPDAPCRYPEKAFQALEGYGFDVSALAAAAGMHYHNGANTMTYFGALLFS